MDRQFKLEVDLSLVYIPPMDEHSTGIIVTRSSALPFVPYNGLRLYSRDWEQDPKPHGLELSNVVWDIDRGVFLAQAQLIAQDLPIALIPGEIRSWLEQGWHWGSLADRYQQDDTSNDPVKPKLRRVADPLEDLNPSAQETIHTQPPPQRPAAFNHFFKALIRHMVVTYSNLETAYAMDKTGRYMGPGRKRSTEQEASVDWSDALAEYKRMSIDDRIKWHKRVEKYPDMASVMFGRMGAA